MSIDEIEWWRHYNSLSGRNVSEHWKCAYADIKTYGGIVHSLPGRDTGG